MLDKESLVQVSTALKAVSLKKMSPQQQLAMQALLNPTPSFLQTNTKSKAPASGEIFGIMKQMKEGENGDAVEIAATSKADLADTEEQLAADSTFLANLREICGNLDKEFAKRTQARATEMAAVSEAIGILTDDDAHDLFGKSLGFIQLSNR